MQLQKNHLLTALLTISLISPAWAHKHEPEDLISPKNALFIAVAIPALHSLYTFFNTEHDGKPARHSFKNLTTALKKCVCGKNKKSAAQSVIQELKYFYFDGLCKPNKSKKSSNNKHSHDADHATCDHDHSDAHDRPDTKSESDDSLSAYGWVQKKGKPLLFPIIIGAKAIDEARLLHAFVNGKITLLQFFTESVGVCGDPLKPNKAPSCC